MAYGTRFQIEGVDDKGRALRVYLKKKDYSSLITIYSMAEDGVIMNVSGLLDPHQYSPIRATNGSAYVWDDGTIEAALTAAGQTEYQVEVTLGGVTIFQGYAEPRMQWRESSAKRLSTNSGDQVRYVTEIGFICGLSLLKFFPYVQSDGDVYSGGRPIVQVIQECLDPLGLERDLCYSNEWFTPDMEAGDNFLDEVDYDATYLVSDDGSLPSCEQVLEDALVANTLELCQWSTFGWVAVQMRQFLSDLIPCNRLDYTGATQTAKNIVSIVIQTEAEQNARTGGEVHPVIPALNSVSVSLLHQKTPNVVKNPAFSTEQFSFERGGEGSLYSSYFKPIYPEWDWRRTKVFAFPWLFGNIGEPADYWAEVDTATLTATDVTVRTGVGPNGENAVFLDRSDAGDGATDPLGDWFDDSDFFVTTGDPPFSTARKVVGGTGRRLIWQASHLVSVRAEDGEDALVDYPAYAEFKILQGATTKWLQNDGSWASSQAIIRFGSADGSEEGIPPDRWVSMAILTDDLPSGTWHVCCRLYGAVDVSTTNSMIGCLWTNVIVDVVTDGVIAPVAEVVTVTRSSSLDIVAADYQVRFGSTPMLDMPGAALYGSVVATDIKIGEEYDDEQPATGRSIQQAIAEIFLSFQAQPLKNRQLGYTSAVTDYIPPCAPFVIKDGSTELVRYRVSDWQWNLGRCVQGGILSLVEELSPATTITRTPQPGS